MRTTDPSLLDAFMCTSSTSQAAAMLVSADIPFPGMDVKETDRTHRSRWRTGDAGHW